MNRLDPRLGAQTPSRVLSRARLSAWSAEGLALAQKLARAPMTVTGGWGNTRLTLDLPAQAPETPEVLVPLHLGGETVDLALGSQALDGLAALLGQAAPAGAGRTLSLDAIEALIAGLLAPLVLDGIGHARLASAEDGRRASETMAALRFETVTMPVIGIDLAIASLCQRVGFKVDRLVAAPLSFLKSTNHVQAAVEVETLAGLVQLSAEDRAALQPGGGVFLDAHWPDGRTCIGRRFVATQGGWRLDDGLSGDRLLVRAGKVVRGLDDPALGEPAPRTGVLDLVDGQEVLATGYLASLPHEDGPKPIFVLDRTDPRS